MRIQLSVMHMARVELAIAYVIPPAFALLKALVLFYLL